MNIQGDFKILAFVVAVLAVAVGGCRKTDAEAGNRAHAAPAPASPRAPVIDEATAGEVGEQTASTGTVGVRSEGDEGVADGDEEDDQDFWSKVRFDVLNFDEVLDYVSNHYIEAVPDKKRAWVEAANFALLSLEPSEELLPTEFWMARAKHPDEEGRLDGRTEPMRCGDGAMAGVVLHHVPSDDYLKAKRPVRKKGRLSNEEVMALRAKSKARNLAYNEAWKAVAFERKPQFECVMAYVKQRIQQYHARKQQGLPPLKDDPPVAAAAPGKPVEPVAAVAPNAKREPNIKLASAAKAPTHGMEPVPAQEPQRDAKDGAANQKGDERKSRDPTLDRAWLAAASGYLYALDPHSAVVAREQWDKSTQQTQDNSFEGIGAVLTQRDDMTIVENPMEGRPAWRAGVRAGDVIHKVDGNEVGGWMLSKVVKLIRGKKGTTVVLTITRESDPEPRDVPIVREHIDIKNVDGKLLPDYPGVAHVKMAGFIPRSVVDLRDMLERLGKQAPDGKLTGVILDLRNNSGGLLNKAIDVADMFLSDGKIVSVKSRKKTEEIHEATSSRSDLTVPMVVLVNDGSASASEIVASAIQDNLRGLVVGMRTFGKASVQTLFEPQLHQDYYIKLTVARYYAPSGETIQVIGVQPDAELTPDVDGKMPVGVREENLNNHLVPIEGVAKSPWNGRMPAIQKCVTDTGKADKIATREKNPQIHPDFQMLRAADYVVCLGKLHPPVP
jgi:C-terminal peptidase prc